MDFTLTEPAPASRALPPSLQLSDRQKRQLAALHNRRTLYEIEIVRADGASRLLCYSDSKAGRSLVDALDKRRDHVARFLGLAEPLMATWGDTRATVKIFPGAIVRATGRTKRDVIVEGREIPYVGD